MSKSNSAESAIESVALLAPTLPDASLCEQILSQAQINLELCRDIDALCDAVSRGVGVGIAPESHLNDIALERLQRVLQQQPEWSDIPLLVLVSQAEMSSQRVDQLLSLGNVTLVPTPLRISVLVSKLRARLRDRQRQLTVRNLIAERRQAAETAEVDSRRLRLALQAGQMGVWEWSRDELYWSSRFCELFGFAATVSPDPALCFERVHQEDRDGLIERWQRSLDEGVELEMEFRIHHPELGQRWLSAAGEPVRNELGEVVRNAGVVWDVTQRHTGEASLREARAQAEAANRSKSEFLANMSHEIRTPMTAILGYVDLLREHAAVEQASEYVETIRRNGFYLLEIINDILDLSKIEAGRVELYREQFSPHRLIEDVRSIMAVRAAENRLRFNVECSPQVPHGITADQKRLKQILINLIGNAIKFTPQGSVTLFVDYDSFVNQVSFRVSDTGIGMTERQLRRLFQPFNQVDSSETRQHEGTGLGLAISQRLANMMGGEISVESQPGAGSSFLATIDAGEIHNAPNVPPAVLEGDDALDVQRENEPLDCSVLVVDDRRDIRFLATRMLIKAGAKTVEAEDGQEAVQVVQEMLREKRIVDLILLDMQMPRLDGYSTAEKLRRMGYRGPIVALTADAMQGDMDRCIESGCNEYLSKPIDHKALLHCVRRLTASSEKQ